MVECLPNNPATWVRFLTEAGKILSLYDTHTRKTGPIHGKKGQYNFVLYWPCFFLYWPVCHKYDAVRPGYILEDLTVLKRSPDLLNNVKIGQDQLGLKMKHILIYGGCSHFGHVT